MEAFDVLKVTSKITGRSEYLKVEGVLNSEGIDPMAVTYLYQSCSVLDGTVRGYDYYDRLMDICPLEDLKVPEAV